MKVMLLFLVKKKKVKLKRTSLDILRRIWSRSNNCLWEVGRDLCSTHLIKDFESEVTTSKTGGRNMGSKPDPKSADQFKQMLVVKP